MVLADILVTAEHQAGLAFQVLAAIRVLLAGLAPADIVAFRAILGFLATPASLVLADIAVYRALAAFLAIRVSQGTLVQE